VGRQCYVVTETERVPQKRLSERAKASEKEPRRQQSATAFVSGELSFVSVAESITLLPQSLEACCGCDEKIFANQITISGPNLMRKRACLPAGIACAKFETFFIVS